MAVVAGVDVGNATTEVAFLDGTRLIGVDRVPTRGRKGSADSLRAAAALVRRLERRLGCRVGQARVAPLRAVDTTTLTIPAAPPATGRLRLIAAGVATPGGAGAWAGVPLWLDRPLPPAWEQHTLPPAWEGCAPPAREQRVPPTGEDRAPPAGEKRVPSTGEERATPAGKGRVPPTGEDRAPPPGGGVRAAGAATPPRAPRTAGSPAAGFAPAVPPAMAAPRAVGPPAVALVPAGFGYARAAERLRALMAAGVPVGAVLAGGDEGVLIFNRLSAPVPVIDQVDLAAVADCDLVAVEVRPPGDALTLLADPVALSAVFSLSAGEAGDAAALCRTLVDFSNAVVGRAAPPGAGPSTGHSASPGAAPSTGHSAGPGAGYGGSREHRAQDDAGPWVGTAAERLTLRSACALVPGWPVGAVRTLGTGDGQVEVDDLFALDLAEVADTATARRGRLGSAALVASLRRMTDGADHAAILADLLGLPVHGTLSEPAAARLGALTTTRS